MCQPHLIYFTGKFNLLTFIKHLKNFTTNIKGIYNLRSTRPIYAKQLVTWIIQFSFHHELPPIVVSSSGALFSFVVLFLSRVSIFMNLQFTILWAKRIQTNIPLCVWAFCSFFSFQIWYRMILMIAFSNVYVIFKNKGNLKKKKKKITWHITNCLFFSGINILSPY